MKIAECPGKAAAIFRTIRLEQYLPVIQHQRAVRMIFVKTVTEFILQRGVAAEYPIGLCRSADRPDHRVIQRMGQGESGRQTDIAALDDSGEDLGVFQTHFYYMSIGKKSYR